MRLFRQVLFGSFALLLITMLVPTGKISAMIDERTVATFNAPFQVPGQVLPGGTYVFKLIEPMENRSIVRIMNDTQTKVLVTAVAIPTYRSDEEARRNDKPVLTFEERAEGSPHALRAWFYPGENYGHEFVYSPSEIATTTNEASATTMNSSEQTSSVSENNEAKEEANLTTPPPPETTPQPQYTDQGTTTQPQTTATTSNAPAAELPKTASSTPLIALMGMLSFGAAIGLWILSKRIS